MSKRREADSGEGNVRDTLDAIRHAFAEFLCVPTCIITGFLLLAAGTYLMDSSQAAWLEPARGALEAYMFADAEGTASLLSTVAGGLFTVTSITVTLLLIALQQAASALTHQVYDQFLRRRHNQFYFGFFVGLTLYALVTLATAGPINPAFGGAVTIVLTALALYMLLVLFYTTIDQMRPVVIIAAIHDHVLRARKVQRGLLRKTRRTSSCAAPLNVRVHAIKNGFVTRIDVDAIAAAAARAEAEVEVVLKVSVGTYVAFGEVLAEIKSHLEADADAVGRVLHEAVRPKRQRDITLDPLDGIEELETIAWTTISTAQSDPDPGQLTIFILRDLLARWSNERDEGPAMRKLPIVYEDNVFARLMNAFESLAVSCAESMQHQNIAEILRSVDLTFDRLPEPQQRRAEDLLLRTLTALGDHVLTAELDGALVGLIATLKRAGRDKTAAAIETAHDRLARSIGKLGSRSTRVS